MKSIACPSPHRLKALLETEVPTVEQEDLSAHLDECESCRQRLEQFEQNDFRLAAGKMDFNAAASPDLSRARERLERHPPVAQTIDSRLQAEELSPPAPALSTELPSGYLRPADDPKLLGMIGGYEILERIGNGGMGVVLKGRDPRLNRVVAIKVLAPHLAASGAARQRFAREARAAAAVAHEHLVTIHAVEEINGLPLMVMQYVPGASLRERIDQEGPLDVRRIVRIAMQTAAGLAAAHALGVIHRDIKPGNILLEDGIERVRLTDFGLATVSDEVALTQTGFLAGTPQYMSPEQIQGGVVDARSDLFSLGSVIYEMCTGRPAFRGSNTYTVLQRVCNEQPRPIHEINPDVPLWLAQIVERLHQKDPRARFQSAGELVEALRERLIQLQQPAAQRAASGRLNESTSEAAIIKPAVHVSPGTATAGESSRGDPTVGLIPPAIMLLSIALLTLALAPLGFVFGWLDGDFPFDVMSIVLTFCVLAVGLPTLLLSLVLLQRRSYLWSLSAAIFAMLPLTPLFILTLPLGLWTLIVLLQPKVKEALDRKSRPPHAEDMSPSLPPKPGAYDKSVTAELKGPLLGLRAAALVQLAIGFVTFAMLLASNFFGISGWGLSIWSIGLLYPLLLLGILASLGQLIAANLALAGSRSSARTAALLAALPLTPAWPIGICVAIWTWIVLHRQWSGGDPFDRKGEIPGSPPMPRWPVFIGLAAVAVLAMLVIAEVWRPSGAKTGVVGQATKTLDLQGQLQLALNAPQPPALQNLSFPLGPSPLREFDLERPATGAVDFSPDGNLVATGDRDGFIRLHFASNGQSAMTLIQSREPVKRLAFSSDGLRLAASRELAIDLWDLNKKKLLRSVKPPAEGESAGGHRVLFYLADGKLIFDRGKSLIIDHGDKPVTLEHPAEIVSGSLSSDKERFATGDALGLVRIWKLNDLSLKTSFQAGRKPAQVSFLSSELVAVESDRKMQVRNLQNEVLADLEVRSELLAEEGSGWLGTIGGDLIVRLGVKPERFDQRYASVLVWHWADESLAANFEASEQSPLGLAIDEKNQRMAIVSEGKLRMFSLSDLRTARPAVGDPQQTSLYWAEEKTGPAEEPYFLAADVSSAGRAIVTGHRDGSLAWWDLASNSQVAKWQMSEHPVRDVRLGPTDEFVLAGDDGGNLAVTNHYGKLAWKTQTDQLFPDDRKLGIVGVGFMAPYVVYGYQSRTSRKLSGIYAVSVATPGQTLSMGADHEIPYHDVAVARDGTCWSVDDHSLFRDRLLKRDYSDGTSSFNNDHSRCWQSPDWLGAVSITATGLPIVGTSLPPTLSAAERLAQSQNCSVRLIDPEEGRVLRRFWTGPGEVTAIAASEWRFVAAAVELPEKDRDTISTIYIWDAVLGSEIIRWPLDERVSALAFVPAQRGGEPSQIVIAGERLRVFEIPSDAGTP